MNQISLAGTWQVSWTDGQHGRPAHFLQPLRDPARWLSMSFPGSIHAGLQKIGLIDDPRESVNSLKARWVEEQYWLLRREFDVPAEAVSQPAYLRFDVLDGVAQVALNGERVGSHANAHRPAEFDVTGRLRPGRNEISLLLETGLFTVADLPGGDYSIAPETLLNKRHQLRQAQYQFGWDWNPRLVYCGLHGDLSLNWGTRPSLKQVTVLAEVDAGLSSARIRVRPSLRLPGGDPLAVTLRLTSIDGLSAEASLTLPPGESEAELLLEVPQPRLWWPRGYGEAHLYPLELTVESGGEILARWQGRTGLRRVEIDQPPHPEIGRYFHLKINNRPIFCKGANWVPPELSGHEVAPERVARLVDLAIQENMNMLRLWGGGVWANHTLLELCDERGILLWHDLLFACSKYPADRPDFLAEVEREVAWGVREFSPHPSLVVWCGNNELEIGLWSWHYKEFGRTAPDLVLFHHVFPALMARIDPTRPYWPSSPYSSPTEIADDPTVGDQHPWGASLGEDGENFWVYRRYVDRFPNEGGVLGCAPLASLSRFLKGDECKLRSFAWEHHENTVNFWQNEPGVGYRAVARWLDLPVMEMDESAYTLASGLLQAEGLREYIHNYRRRWPSTGSAIYWMFNDSWPTVHGWGTFDYYLNRKLSFHPVRRAFAEVIVVLADEETSVGVYVVNDTDQPVSLALDCGVFQPEGPLQPAASLQVQVAARASQRASEMPRDEAQVYYALLRDPSKPAGQPGALIAQERLLLRPWKSWQFSAPRVQVEALDKYARYTSPAWVWGVVLDPTGECPVSDDVFDLLPGVPYDVPLAPGEAPRPVAATGNALLK